MDFYSFKNQCARMVVIDFAHHINPYVCKGASNFSNPWYNEVPCLDYININIKTAGHFLRSIYYTIHSCRISRPVSLIAVSSLSYVTLRNFLLLLVEFRFITVSFIVCNVLKFFLIIIGWIFNGFLYY